MNDKKNIDKLFKEQLKDFEVAPDDFVWENIYEELHKDKRKRRVIIPLWWQIAGVAAALAIMIAVGSQVFNSSEINTPENIIVKDDTINSETPSESDSNNNLEDNNNNRILEDDNNQSQIANSNTNETPSEKENSSIVNSNKNQQIINQKDNDNIVVSQNNSNIKNSPKKDDTNSVNGSNKNANKSHFKNPIIDSNSKEDAVANSKEKSNNPDQNSQAVIKNKSEIDAIIKSSTEITKTSVTETNTSQDSELKNTNQDASYSNQDALENPDNEEEKEATNAIENAIAEAENTNEEEKEDNKKLNRWSVSPNVAPVYFSSLGEGSSIDDQFVGNSTESDINMSYGVSGSYAINNKFKIRAGVNRVDLNYTTNDVLIFESNNASTLARTSNQMPNIDMAENVGRYSVYSAGSFNFNAAPTSLLIQEQGALDQQLGFIEVPIEIEYSVVEKKLGVNIIGGFSTLFLNQNDIFAVFNDGNRERIGDASNVRDMSYSANFGLGLDYNFSEQWQFNLEPTFKYQINTFENTSGDFQPFFIGVYTGLSFKF